MMDWLPAYQKERKKEINQEKRRIEREMLADLKKKHDKEREEKIEKIKKEAEKTMNMNWEQVVQLANNDKEKERAKEKAYREAKQIKRKCTKI